MDRKLMIRNKRGIDEAVGSTGIEKCFYRNFRITKIKDEGI